MGALMTVNQLARLSVVLTAAALLAGCAGVARTNNATQFSYNTSMLNDIAKRGGTPLVVAGEPFPDSPDQFAQRASEILTNAHRGPRFPVYLDDAQRTGNNPWRTVVIVNPERGVSASNACTDTVSSTAVTDGRMTAVAALCLGKRAKTIVRSWASDASGPGSPAVEQVLRQTALALYPVRDENTDLDSPGGAYDM